MFRLTAVAIGLGTSMGLSAEAQPRSSRPQCAHCGPSRVSGCGDRVPSAADLDETVESYCVRLPVHPEAMALLESLGSQNNHNCQVC